MMDHFSLHVKDYARSKEFYTKALKPLGYTLSVEYGTAGGFKEGGHTSFWIVKKERVEPTHLAFRGKNAKAVKDFHSAALAAGGTDNGAPGPRPDYSPDYYAAFVFDPDGHNIEAMCFEEPTKKSIKKKK
ncbi:MAG: VOC family protein [Patescibacteria group bacterium]|nr:VOC family protein [Patescibacteria group bacterium]